MRVWQSGTELPKSVFPFSTFFDLCQPLFRQMARRGIKSSSFGGIDLPSILSGLFALKADEMSNERDPISK
jgi:hypothetical protein